MYLVLDLDHTLVQATDNAEKADQARSVGLPVVEITLKHTSKPWYVCLRPGVREFLAQVVSDGWSPVVYTAGAMDYALQVVRVLDPENRLFCDRVVARPEDIEQSQLSSMLKTCKKLQACCGVTDAEQMHRSCLVLDDRDEVWEERLRYGNLLHISEFAPWHDKYYHPIKSPKADNQLLGHIFRILQKLQRYRNFSSNCSGAMQEYRGSILAGCRIAFSSSVPINGEPSANFYWRRATSFGAVCQIGYDGPPTHIITSQAGEQDSLALKRNPGIRMVNMDWLLQSAKKFEKQDESLFAVRPVPVSAAALQAYAAPPPVAPPQSYPPQVAPPQSYPPQVVPPQSYPPPAAPPQSQSYPYYGTDYTAQGYPPYHNPALMSSTTTTTTYYQNQTQSMHQPYTNNAHPPPPREDDYNTWAALAKFVASDPTGKIPANDIKRFYNTVPIAKMVLGGGGNGGSLKSRIEQYGAAHGLQWENDGRAGLIAVVGSKNTKRPWNSKQQEQPAKKVTVEEREQDQRDAQLAMQFVQKTKDGVRKSTKKKIGLGRRLQASRAAAAAAAAAEAAAPDLPS
jgi:hypothetical protein